LRVEIDGMVLEGPPEEVLPMVRALRGEAPALTARPVYAAPAKTVRELWKDYAVYAESRIKSFKHHRKQVEGSVVAWFGDKAWNTIDQAMVDAYIAKRAEDPGQREGQKTSPSTRRRELTWLASMFTWALRRKLIDRHPTRGLERESIKDCKRKCYLDEPTFERLVAAAPCEIAADMFRVWFWEGCRRDEIRLLRKSEVNHEAKMLLLHGSRIKNGQDKVIPLADVSYEIIRRWSEVSRGDYVFGNPRNHTVPVPPTTLGYWFRRARSKSGVKGLGGRPEEVIVLHGLRRSFATGMAAVSAPLQLVQQGGGWNDPEMAKQYTQLHGETLETLRDFKNLRVGAKKAREENVSARTKSRRV